MARRKDSPQKAAMREMMRDYLKNNDISIKDGTDVNSIMRDMMSVILEGVPLSKHSIFIAVTALILQQFIGVVNAPEQVLLQLLTSVTVTV